MRENVNWEYISKLPKRLQKGLFYLLDTGNLHTAADNAGVPIDGINAHRKKKQIFSWSLKNKKICLYAFPQYKG